MGWDDLVWFGLVWWHINGYCRLLMPIPFLNI